MLREMLSERELEELEKFLERVKEMNKEIPIVVEGKHDESALRNLGFSGEIIKINTGVSMVSLADSLSSLYSEVILLLDWDERGERNAKRLSELLIEHGVNPHLEIREELKRRVYHIRTVESLII